MTWTDDRIATLKQCWNDGFSASQTAHKLGGVSRNAVIGKVHRLGLAGRIRSSRHRRSVRDRPASRIVRAHAPRRRERGSICFRRRSISARPESPRILPDLGPASPTSITVSSLTMFTCRWPEGDPKAAGFHFCGRTKQRLDIPYCDHHAAIAFR
jgi:GcrA cell cycle regulator